ncbi:MAG: hypothetical protein U0231_16280 [Nitrospiraceae bacterium]
MPRADGNVIRRGDIELVSHRMDFEEQRRKVAGLEKIPEGRRAGGSAGRPWHVAQRLFPLGRRNSGAFVPKIQGIEQWEQIEQQMVAARQSSVASFGQCLYGQMAERWESPA